MPSYTNSQNLNRYSYVINNPLRYTDPTGHMVSDGGDGGVACTVTHTCGGGGNSGNNGGGGGNGGGSGGAGGDGGITIPFDTDEIANSIPGTYDLWSGIASTADETALAWDTLLGIYVLTWVGIGLAGGLMFEGNPVTGLAGAVAGYIIGEGSVFTSGALFPANLVASGATVAGAIADAKSGDTSIDGQLSISPNGINLTANGQVASTTAISTALSSVGWPANIVSLSLPLQLAAVENDRGTFGSSSLPVDLNISFP